MFRLAEQMQSDPELLGALHLTSTERELIAVDPGYREVSPTTRLDSFMAGESWRFVEYNAETPAAVAYEDVLSELFMELPVMQAFSREYRLTPLPARHRLLETLLGVYRQWGGREEPAIAIVDWEGVPTATEFELFERYFGENGLQSVICTPGDLSYHNDRLYARDQAVDLVYKRVLISELLSHPDDAEPLLRAYRDRRVCVVNSFRSKLLHKKLIFAILSDDRYARHFSDAERAAIAEHIPWTREVAEGHSTYGGQTIDLIPYIIENRERLVLKPNDEYGGKGVVIGWESTPEAWGEGVRSALLTPFAVQERVAVDRVPFPMWIEGALAWPELAADLDPFLFHTDVTGVLTRLSATSLLNVTAGVGSTAPTFLVEPK